MVAKKKTITKKDLKDPKDQKIDDLTDTLQRLQADFENYKKVIDKDNERFKASMEAGFIQEILPIIDHFQLALEQDQSKPDFIKGVEMIYSQLFTILEQKGLIPIEAMGKEFDPYKHEVLLQEESEKDNIVLEELQKGYMLGDKVLRLSKVKIGKKKDGSGKGRVDKKVHRAEKDS